MEISPIQSVSAGVDNTFQEAPSNSNNALGSDQFLKLLTVQLSNQDPLEPMKDTAFIAQMANFSSLEQMSQLASTMASFSSNQMEISSQAFLGKQVTLEVIEGQAVRGEVTAVSMEGDKIKVTVNGTQYDISDVKRVELIDTKNSD